MSINLQCSWTGQLTIPSHKHLLSLTTDEGCLRITTWPPKHGRWAHAAAAAELGGWCDLLHSPGEVNPKALGSCSCFYPFLLPHVMVLNARFDPSQLGSSVGAGRWDGMGHGKARAVRLLCGEPWLCFAVYPSYFRLCPPMLDSSLQSPRYSPKNLKNSH